MQKPYTITHEIWADYYAVQKSGTMNMFGHPYVIYFFEGDAYSQAKNHFEVEGNTSDLLIE